MSRMPDRTKSEMTAYSAADVEYRDGMQAIASTLAGVEEALSYRAEAEDDDMLAMLADAICAQVDKLRQLVEEGKR